MEIEFTLNGSEYAVSVDQSEALLEVLRRLGYTGAKRGCNEGSCGFCTILIDGEAEKSCLVPVSAANGAEIETIEGLGTQDNLDPIQQAFVDNAALQCGYCIPGMIMRSKALLEENPEPTEREIREGLSDNLCRCTGYEKIITAVKDAATTMNAEVATDGGTQRGREPHDCCGGDECEYP